jgi:hypothetical protein
MCSYRSRLQSDRADASRLTTAVQDNSVQLCRCSSEQTLVFQMAIYQVEYLKQGRNSLQLPANADNERDTPTLHLLAAKEHFLSLCSGEVLYGRNRLNGDRAKPHTDKESCRNCFETFKLKSGLQTMCSAGGIDPKPKLYRRTMQREQEHECLPNHVPHNCTGAIMPCGSQPHFMGISTQAPRRENKRACFASAMCASVCLHLGRRTECTCQYELLGLNPSGLHGLQPTSQRCEGEGRHHEQCKLTLRSRDL